MAGDFAITARFTKADMDTLTRAKLGVTVLVDLSHNSFTTTTEHPSGLQVISKPVELDIQVSKGTATPTDFFSGPREVEQRGLPDLQMDFRPRRPDAAAAVERQGGGAEL